MTEHCTNCGALCSGELNIEVRKGNYKSFCSYCFDLFMSKDLKEINKILKNNKISVIL